MVSTLSLSLSLATFLLSGANSAPIYSNESAPEVNTIIEKNSTSASTHAAPHIIYVPVPYGAHLVPVNDSKKRDAHTQTQKRGDYYQPPGWKDMYKDIYPGVEWEINAY